MTKPYTYILTLTFIFILSICFISFAQEESLWQKPADWPATIESSRKPFSIFYNSGSAPTHSPTDAHGLGLKWQLPLRQNDLGKYKINQNGYAYCPTMKGREKGSWSHRYRGIHRGHDFSISTKQLNGQKIPVRLIADGVYDGQRKYKHAKKFAKQCQPLVFYHFAKSPHKGTYTSIYCHADPSPNLQPGQKLKAGDIIAFIENPEGAWNAHVHLELYSRPVYSSKDTTKFKFCKCSGNNNCDTVTKNKHAISRGCGIFEDDAYILEPLLFIKRHM